MGLGYRCFDGSRCPSEAHRGRYDESDGRFCGQKCVFMGLELLGTISAACCSCRRQDRQFGGAALKFWPAHWDRRRTVPGGCCARFCGVLPPLYGCLKLMMDFCGGIASEKASCCIFCARRIPGRPCLRFLLAIFVRESEDMHPQCARPLQSGPFCLREHSGVAAVGGFGICGVQKEHLANCLDRQALQLVEMQLRVCAAVLLVHMLALHGFLGWQSQFPSVFCLSDGTDCSRNWGQSCCF